MELFRALGCLLEPPTLASRRLADLLDLGPVPDDTEYTELFEFQLYPYASVYLGPEGMLGGEARDRIAGFWRALGETPPTEPDHLAVMLACYASLCELESEADSAPAAQAGRQARHAFLWEHLLSFLPAFLAKTSQLHDGFYAAWARVLDAALREEASRVGGPQRLPLHLRDAPALPDPRQDSPEAFVPSLLSPVRSGLILVRSDLRRAAGELGLGLRAGERKYALEALLGQDAAATLGWLAAEARRWVGAHRSWSEVTGDVARFWIERADRTNALLDSLSREASTA
jgi:hypothetical protein